MAKELKPRTEFARRLIEARLFAGYQKRVDWAEFLGIPVDTLGSYERGIAPPGIELLTKYRDGLGIDLNWLITGDGEMQAASGSGAAPPSAARTIGTTMDWVGKAVLGVYREQKVTIPQAAQIGIVSQKVVELIERAGPRSGDLNYIAELLPWLEDRVRQELKEAAAEPGTGKHAAS